MNVEPKNVNSGNFHINLQPSRMCVLQVGFPLHIFGFSYDVLRAMHYSPIFDPGLPESTD